MRKVADWVIFAFAVICTARFITWDWGGLIVLGVMAFVFAPRSD